MDVLDDHAKQIERLLNADRQQILVSKIKGLLQGIWNNELTVDDVVRFTNISAEQLQLLLKETK
jgi:hypothetical protein